MQVSRIFLGYRYYVLECLLVPTSSVHLQYHLLTGVFALQNNSCCSVELERLNTFHCSRVWATKKCSSFSEK